jgi:DNA-binding transcriptional LysR family regulator
MNPTLLKTFVAVAELRHFARAANACNISQPAVSHQIAQLEAEVGAKLLNRAPRRVSLTVAGEVMLEEARRILAAIDRARERMQEVASGAIGRIRLGASATPGLYLLPPLLREYRTAHPSFDLDFSIGAADDISERVIRNDLDMAVIAGHPPTTELRSKTLVHDELVAIAAPGAEPAGRRKLDHQCWILREEKSTTRREVDAWLDRHRIVPPRTMVFNGPDAVKRAVMAGLGISIVSKLSADEDLAANRLIAFDTGLPLPKRDICVIDHPQKHHGAACGAMLAMFRAKFSSGST